MIPEQIIRAAMADPLVDDGVVRLADDRREPLWCEGRVVGFVTPRLEGEVWRHGPIYILPGFRRRGLIRAYFTAHPERSCVAFVDYANPGGLRAYIAAGFSKFRRQRYGWFLRRAAKVLT